MYTEELLNKYDGIIQYCVYNIWEKSNYSEKIILTNIDRNNKEHLLILRLALIAKDIYNRPMYMKTGLWNWIVLNWRMRKLTMRVSRVKKDDVVHEFVDVNTLLEAIRQVVLEYLGEEYAKNFSFADIYEAYYKGELD